MRSLGLLPESLSHDWHVQPSCQRPNRTPPERREFSPGNSHECESDCPRNLTNIQCGGKSCQRQHPTGFPHLLHTGKVPLWDACRRARSPPKSRSLTIKPFGMTTFKCGARLQRATVWSSALAQIETQRRTFGARQGGRLEIEKRS